MLTLRVLQRTNVSDNCIFSRSSRFFNRAINKNKNGIGSKIQPPSTPVYDSSNLTLRCLAKPLVFTICFSSGVFVCSSIWQYENMRKRVLSKMPTWFEFTHSPTYKKGQFRRELHVWWNQQSEGQKVVAFIIATNLCVFALWKIKPFQPFMLKYFCSSPANNARCLPMFLSTFSHYSFFHLAANMYVLYSFSTPSVAYLGKEQFVAMYCSAGVISSFTSYLHKVAIGSFGPSLGASGALMAVLSSYSLQFPNAQLALIFLPFFTISAGHALKFIMAMDTVGIFARWKVLDHAAHLGGATFGIVYLKYGCDYIWGNREHVISSWHDFRKKLE